MSTWWWRLHPGWGVDLRNNHKLDTLDSFVFGKVWNHQLDAPEVKQNPPTQAPKNIHQRLFATKGSRKVGTKQAPKMEPKSWGDDFHILNYATHFHWPRVFGNDLWCFYTCQIKCKIKVSVHFHVNKYLSDWSDQVIAFQAELPKNLNPRCSMYGIFTYIYPQNYPNVGK